MNAFVSFLFAVDTVKLLLTEALLVPAIIVAASVIVGAFIIRSGSRIT